MRFGKLLKIEWMKTRRSKIVPLLFVAPLLVVSSGVANLRRMLTPEAVNVWAAMFVQSALLYAYYLLPLSMVVVCVMMAGLETEHNGLRKMLALPVGRYALSAAKFCVLLLYLLMETALFFAVFAVAGRIAAGRAGITETLPVPALLSWCAGLFLTMLPGVAAMWAVTVLFRKPLLAAGINLLLVIPGVLVVNTPLWPLYPWCYSGWLVSCLYHDLTAAGAGFAWFPFLPCAVGTFAAAFGAAAAGFGKESRQ